MIKTTVYPRAALIGNPSDGYFGKTIAFVFKPFKAEVTVEKSSRLRFILGKHDRLIYSDMSDLASDIQQNGYYGGIRLLKATVKRFRDYCSGESIVLPKKNFTIRHYCDIPVRLGLAGSSAIITAAMKAILQFYGIEIAKPVLANLILSVEKDELKIAAGLQDRVAQVYGCPVYMNFDKKLMESQGHGEYVPFDKKLLPPLYIAYKNNLSEGSEVVHNNLAERFAAGDREVLKAVEEWKSLTEQVWNKLQNGDKNIGDLLNLNFDLRRKIMNIGRGNIEMVETARSVGASAKFTGSGGAIIGTYDDENMYDKLVKAMKKIEVTVIKPEIV